MKKFLSQATSLRFQKKISLEEAATMLHLTPDEVLILEKQQILHAIRHKATLYFSAEEIRRIMSHNTMSLAEEAERVGAQIQQEVVSSVSGLQTLRRRLSFAGLCVGIALGISTVMLAFLFTKYTEETSDFFGYYYRLNAHPNVLGAAIGPDDPASKTSVFADVIKPLAETSLLIVKATDNTKYQQIITKPLSMTSPPGPPGKQGPPGTNGLDGKDGINGTAGLTGANGSNGSNGTNGSDATAIESDTLATVTSRGAATTTALTLSNSANIITVGALTATGGSIDGITIGATSSSSASFTTLAGLTINGLTITNNGSNTLSIAAGKTFTANNTLTFAGTDGTTLTFPSSSDTIVGLSASQTLSNKTIAAGSNTISGLTNANLSGSAGITNANLANSSLTVTAGTGLSGGGAVSLGGVVTLTNSGVTSLTGTSNQVTVSGATGAVTLSLPQNIDTAATPTFGGITVNGTASTSALKIGGGTTITKHLSGTNTFDASSIAVTACSNIGTVTVTGAAVGDTVVATPTAVSGGIETLTVTWNAYVSSSNTVTIRACNLLSLLGQDPANQTWRADVWQH